MTLAQVTEKSIEAYERALSRTGADITAVVVVLVVIFGGLLAMYWVAGRHTLNALLGISDNMRQAAEANKTAAADNRAAQEAVTGATNLLISESSHTRELTRQLLLTIASFNQSSAPNPPRSS